MGSSSIYTLQGLFQLGRWTVFASFHTEGVGCTMGTSTSILIVSSKTSSAICHITEIIDELKDL
jgi:hypothetical protein